MWIGPDLNPWYRVLYRRVNQKIRKFYMRCRPKLRSRLWRELMTIADSQPDEPLPEADRRRMSDLHWRLGTGIVYRYTPEQERLQHKLAEEIVARLRSEEQGDQR